MRETDLPSGTLYPVLARMEAEGWLVSEREPAKAHGEGRPRRRYYTLTELGRSTGAGQLAQVMQRLQPKPASARFRPALAPIAGLTAGRLA
ncbi:PadR family transcriptional regulator [Micromonospora sp. WMMD734]|uniref:PadR family transcriptional regulator n=1 Tax=Micromonospora sp. WMMD734 TaxID=3404129 RepID=UPI003B96434C